MVCSLVCTKNITFAGKDMKLIMWRTHMERHWYKAYISPETHKAATDRTWEDKWKRLRNKEENKEGNKG
jgi:hypothetical protein